ncbi:MAG: ABC transporter permease [Anaerolineales bacterium]|nr:ABC transporter permease [Anaerolineales bacterium]MCS7248463.1 ABC transporter permease [Anaerolineales bacterium]MDW8162276.1 ABC transporter permease [Anaerolineales bacterium]MDW8447332.1 ABC transporter permease [Anaerolineales bacterium]
MRNSTALASKSHSDAIVIRPSQGWMPLNLQELWAFRELIYFLTWRDIKVRYKQTVLGAAWAVLQPLINMLVLTFIFGNLARLSTDNIPRPIFTFTALLPWGLFSKALADAGRSMLTNRSMITKVYFPRLIIPLSSVLGGLLDFVIQFFILVGMMTYYRILPTHAVWTLPFFVLLALVTALGFGLWLSALNVLYRDVGYILPFLTQIWMLVTPVAYSARTVPTEYQFFYALNPMVGVVEGFRWALLGARPPEVLTLTMSSLISLAVLLSGMYYFRRMERTFADMV